MRNPKEFINSLNDWNQIMPEVRRAVDYVMDDDDAFNSDEYSSILDTVPLANISDTKKVLIEFFEAYPDA